MINLLIILMVMLYMYLVHSVVMEQIAGFSP